MSDLNSLTFDADNLDFSDLQFESTPAAINAPKTERDMSFFKNIPVTVTLEVSSTEISLGELMKAGEGSVIALNKLNGEPLDVKVNGSLIGHAEVVVINDKYGLRLIDIIDSPFNSLDY